jgi:hypothetical protein
MIVNFMAAPLFSPEGFGIVWGGPNFATSRENTWCLLTNRLTMLPPGLGHKSHMACVPRSFSAIRGFSHLGRQTEVKKSPYPAKISIPEFRNPKFLEPTPPETLPAVHPQIAVRSRSARSSLTFTFCVVTLKDGLSEATVSKNYGEVFFESYFSSPTCKRMKKQNVHEGPVQHVKCQSWENRFGKRIKKPIYRAICMGTKLITSP